MTARVQGPRERPILFSGPMVRAILDGRKSQTRRIVRRPERYLDSQWEQAVPHNPGGGAHPLMGHCYLRVPAHDGETLADCVMGGREHAPYEPGMRLWVKEACWIWGYWEREFGKATRTGRPKWRFREVGQRVTFDKPESTAKRDGRQGWVYRHARYVPRWASRITLKVTSVRVERLQAITEEDAQAEGVPRDTEPCDHKRQSCADIGCLGPTHRASFSELWNVINGERAPWESNPWVWVVSFRRVEP